MSKKEDSFVRMCKLFSKYFKSDKIDPKLEEAIAFLEWNISSNQVFAFAKGVFVLTVAFTIIFFLISNLPNLFDPQALLDDLINNRIYFSLILIGIVLYLYIPKYPLSLAEQKKKSIIFEIPDIVNYMVMYVKMNPNLERAVEFTVSKTKGILSEELKKLLWKTKTGEYVSIEEALDEFAYKWGIVAPYFKKALMGIRGSIIEADEDKRELRLNEILKDLLKSIRDEMETQIMKIKTPSIYLYYIGVLLPLMLIILLPVGLLFINIPINPILLFIFFTIIFPVFVFFLAKSALSNRPKLVEPPKIPKNHPSIKREIGKIKIGKSKIEGKILAIMVFIGTIIIGYFLNDIIYPNVYNDPNYIPKIFYFSIPCAFVFAICIYIYSKVAAIRKLQNKIEELEEEFQDGIYILASRLGEGKPLEEALRHTYMFLQSTNSKIKDLFKEAYVKVVLMGMTLKSAFFDETYGVLRNLPSKFIKNAMELVINAVDLSSTQAAKSLISLTLQLKEQRDLKKYLRKLLLEITSTVMIVTLFVGPIVLGISSTLQKIMADSISGLNTQGLTTGFGGLNFNIQFNQNIKERLPNPFLFIFMIFIYLIEVSCILIYYVSVILYGENKEIILEKISTYLPIIAILYFATAFISSITFGG